VVDRAGQELIARHRIETARLILEPVGPEHAEGLFQATTASRDELLPWMPWAREPSLQSDVEQSTRSAHEWAVGCEFHFTLIERESGAVLGIAGLNAGGEGVFELHYWMRGDRRRRVLTTKAGRELVRGARAGLRAKKPPSGAG